MKKIIVIDTSILCVWLEVYGMETCGPDDDRWTLERVKEKIQEEMDNGSTLVLPLATIIETGNHISQSRGDRYQEAERFKEVLLKSIDNEEPWAAFSEQADLWTDEVLREIGNGWPENAAQGRSIGDLSIQGVAEYYAKMNRYDVEIFTGDQGCDVKRRRI